MRAFVVAASFVVGLAAIIVGVWLIWMPAGVITLGVILTLLGLLVDVIGDGGDGS